MNLEGNICALQCQAEGSPRVVKRCGDRTML